MANKDSAKQVGIVALGGLTDMALEYTTTKFAKQSVDVDKLRLNVADAVGIGTGLAAVGIGMARKSNEASLFGAGALAAALATILGKSFLAYNPLKASASYAGPVNPRASPFAPQANPQQGLIVGTSGGGGKVVYKPNLSTPAPNANNTQLIIG